MHYVLELLLQLMWLLALCSFFSLSRTHAHSFQLEMARNSVAKDILVRMLLGHVRVADETKFASSDIEIVVENHAKLLCELAEKCPHVTENFLTSAAVEAYKMGSWEAKMFASRLHDALAYCK